MLPTLFSIGPISIHSYGVMFAIGFLIALALIRRAAIREGLDVDAVGDAAFWTLLVGLAGTRVLHIIQYPSLYSWRDPIGWIAVWRGGLVFQGAILPIFVFLLVYLPHRGLPFWKCLDISSPAMALCHAFGRIGCFANGCCFGARSDLPWAIPFRRIPGDLGQEPTGSPAFIDHCLRYGLPENAAWSYPVHPTQLYEAAALVCISIVLGYLVKHKRLFDGFVVCVYVLLYSVFRFLNEFLRGDGNPRHIAWLTDQQVFCVLSVMMFGGLMAALWYYARRRRTAEP